jgi:hypothetical protein
MFRTPNSRLRLPVARRDVYRLTLPRRQAVFLAECRWCRRRAGTPFSSCVALRSLHVPPLRTVGHLHSVNSATDNCRRCDVQATTRQLARIPRASWVRRRRSRRRTRMFVSSFIHSCFAFTDLCFTQPPPSPSPPPQPVRQTAAPLSPDAAAVFASPRPTPSAPVRLVFLFLMGRACVWLTPAFLARNIPQTFVCVGCQMSVLLCSSGVCKTAATVKRIMEVLQPDYNYTAGDFVCNSCNAKSKKPAKGKSTSVFFL